MTENPRLEELRRRVQQDPASIAFAQLAEEHRRAGGFEEAIQVCRAGLEQHPGYLSARVTLGRALLEVGQYDDAQAELEFVLRAAPDNLAAIRALAEIHQRRQELEDSGQRSDVSEHAERAEPPPTFTTEPPPLPELELRPPDIEPLAPALDLQVPDPDSLIPDPGSLIPDPEPRTSDLRPLTSDPVLSDLESWLAAILADRQQRRLHGSS